MAKNITNKIFPLFLSLVAGFLLLVAPFPAFAQLVPCGTSSTPPCTVCHLFLLVDNITQWLVTIGFALAGLIIAWGGILILAAAGSPSQMQSGKNAIKAAVVGLVIILVSWIVVDTLIVNLANQAAFPTWAVPWHTISC